MADTLTISVDGLEQVMSNIGKLTPEVEALVQQIFFDGAVQCYDDSQMTVPVDTGALKESGWIQYEEGLITVGYGPGVSGNVDYPIYVELGTSRMAAQSFLVPAFINAVAKIESDLAYLFSGNY